MHRFRSLFRLKSLNSLESIKTIAACFVDKSELLKHEVAYVLGQMKNPLALPFLEAVLEDRTGQESMVRHEAAEAIGAIGMKDSIVYLESMLAKEQDGDPVVRDTILLAIDGLKHKHNFLIQNDEEDAKAER